VYAPASKTFSGGGDGGPLSTTFFRSRVGMAIGGILKTDGQQSGGNAAWDESTSCDSLIYDDAGSMVHQIQAYEFPDNALVVGSVSCCHDPGAKRQRARAGTYFTSKPTAVGKTAAFPLRTIAHGH